MIKGFVYVLLFITYIIYSIIVFTKGTESNIRYSALESHQIEKGKKLFQKHNCTSCHQLFGLGGYLGPELTTAWSDKHRSEAYIKAFLINGGPRMPKFNFTEDEMVSIISFLRYVDSTASTYKISRK